MKVCLQAFLLLLAAARCFGQALEAPPGVKWGMVEGIVVDGDDKPLPNATVIHPIRSLTLARAELKS
jgi:hypothetical protein